MSASPRIDLGLPSTDEESVGVLFSGGRDSSLVASLLAQDGWRVHLITCDNGASIGGDLTQYRVNELQRRFPQNLVRHVTVPCYGLFRRVALADIESDFAKYAKNLITLGSQLAIHAAAIVYCVEQGLTRLASGFTKYQCHLPEQKSEAITQLTEFARQFGIDYATPIYQYASEDAVKYKLFEFGICTKSLESTSVFSDTSTEPAGAQVQAYVSEKLPLCVDHVQAMTRRLREMSAGSRK